MTFNIISDINVFKNSEESAPLSEQTPIIYKK